MELTLRPLPVIPFGPDREMCDGDSVLLDATNPNAIYNWNNGYDGPSKVITKTGTYSVSVYLDGCYADESITLTFKPNPVPELLDDIEKCENSTHVFDAYRKAFDFYAWSNGSNDSAITVNKAGTYAVTVGMDGCTGSDSVRYILNPLPEINLGPDSILCEGDVHVISAEVEGVAIYQWQDNSDQSEFKVWRPGIYYVRLERGGCVAKDTVEFQMKSYPLLSLGGDTTICIGDSLLLVSDDSNSSFIWNGNEEKRSQIVNDSAYVWVVGQNYCGTIRDSINVSVRDCECFMYVPTSFTPDGDDINEFFIPRFDCQLFDYQLTIYNRWGERIFETTDPTQGWDGTSEAGYPLAMGAYVFEMSYRAELENNGSRVSFHKTGKILLLR